MHCIPPILHLSDLKQNHGEGKVRSTLYSDSDQYLLSSAVHTNRDWNENIGDCKFYSTIKCDWRPVLIFNQNRVGILLAI